MVEDPMPAAMISKSFVLFSVLTFGRPAVTFSAIFHRDLPRFARPVLIQIGSRHIRQLLQQVPYAEVLCGEAAFCSLAVLLLSVLLPITAPLVLSILPVLSKLPLSIC
jgi:hypothetical protein